MIGLEEFHLAPIWEELGHTLHHERNHPEIRRWCRQTGLIDDISQVNWYEWQSQDPNTRMYAIVADGEAVGVCGLTSIDHVTRRAEFSLYTFFNHQRKGYARRALRLLFEHGFKDLNLHLIWGETFDGNPAIELFSQMGMKVEGCRRDFYFKDGKYLDAFLLSLKEDEWKPQQS